MEPSKPKVGTLTAGAMLLVAGFFDLFQFIETMLGFLPTVVTQIFVLAVTTPVTIFAYMVFFFWFAFLGVPLFNIKKPMPFFARTGGFLIEMLPFLTALPILSGSVLFTLIEANGPKGFPASLVPKAFLKMTPAGKVVSKVAKAANDNQKEEKQKRAV
tara:strand:+ start:13212 stop:13685 length:474 start_codon:yes stop_codon:yes gene_type:complete